MPAIRHPPFRMARLRISLSAAHTTADVAQLAGALAPTGAAGQTCSGRQIMSLHVEVMGRGEDPVLLHGWAMHGGIIMAWPSGWPSGSASIWSICRARIQRVGRAVQPERPLRRGSRPNFRIRCMCWAGRWVAVRWRCAGHWISLMRYANWCWSPARPVFRARRLAGRNAARCADPIRQVICVTIIRLRCVVLSRCRLSAAASRDVIRELRDSLFDRGQPDEAVLGSGLAIRVMKTCATNCDIWISPPC